MTKKMIALVVIGIVAIAASGAAVGWYNYSGQSQIATAKLQIQKSVRDGETTRYRDVVFRRETGAVCGYYNTKNGFGAYGGFEPFVRLASAKLYLAPDLPRIPADRELEQMSFPDRVKLQRQTQWAHTVMAAMKDNCDPTFLQ